MRKRLPVFLLALVAAGCLLVLWRHFFPNDERRVRHCLAELAQAVSIPDRPTRTAALRADDRLWRLLADGAELDVQAAEIGSITLNGRPEIVELVMRLWGAIQGLRVELIDVQVTLAPDHASATALLTAKATVTGEKDFSVQEFKIQLKQEDRQWRVTRVETVPALRL